MSGYYTLQYSTASTNNGFDWVLLYEPTSEHDYYFTDLTLNRNYMTFTVTSGQFVKNNQYIDATGYTFTITGGNYSNCGGYPACDTSSCKNIEMTIVGTDEMLTKTVWKFKEF